MELHKIVLEKLKARGLNIAEDAAGEAVKAVFEGVREYVQASENQFDDLALAVMPAIESIVLKEIDKIDGKIGA